MYRKHFFSLIVAVTVLLVGGLSAFGQIGDLRGRILLKQADGTNAPVTNAVIDVYRLDTASSQENIKTNKRGEFHILGLFIVGKYILSISAPNAFPKIRSNIKAGQDVDYEIVLEPGDGRRYSMDEAKKAAAGGGDANAGGTSTGTGGGESADDRARREEMVRKNTEIKARNEKVLNVNETIRHAFDAGGKALQAKQYDEAIAQYNLGLAADADQPAILTNKSIALRMRGVDRYNAAVLAQDAAVKSAGIDSAKQDFKEAAESATKAVELAKAQPNGADQAEQARQTSNKNAAIAARADAMKLFVTKVDSTKADDGQAAFQDYVAILTDPALKLKAQLDSAQMLFEAGSIDKAVVEFKKVLETNPDNIDAMLGIGLALFGTADSANYQEAANYLQRFVNGAPDTHALKADAKAVLEELKRQDVKPQKPTGRRRG